MFVFAGLATQAARAGVPASEPNPPLLDSCGMDIMLVLDSSGSLDEAELQEVRDAANTFVNMLLPASPTRIGVVDFDTEVVSSLDLTNDVAALTAAINSISHQAGGGNFELTNWHAALRESTTFLEGGSDRADDSNADLILFITDGDPTTYGYPDALGFFFDPDEPHPEDINNAVLAANDAKTSSSSQPIRIIAIGVSNSPTLSNLIAIAGPVVSPLGEPVSAETDVITTSFSELAGILANLALSMCNGNVTVQEVIDIDGNIGTTGDQSDGVGWIISANVDAPDFATPPSGATGSDGTISFKIDLGLDFTGTVDIVQTLKSDFDFISASCERNGSSIGTPGTNRVDNLVIASQELITCTFYNQPDCTFLNDGCIVGVYNEQTGECEATPVPSGGACDSDGDLCTGDRCDSSGVCVPHAPFDVVCAAPATPCDGGEACNSTTGQCEAQPDAAEGAACDSDGDLCTGERCDSGGLCVSAAASDVVCQDPNPPCEGGQFCDSATGTCVDNADAGTETSCEADGDLCTIDRCSGFGACVQLDVVNCQAPDPPCEGGESCNRLTGLCETLPDGGQGTLCEADSDICTEDHCNGRGECLFVRHQCGACCMPSAACLNDILESDCLAADGDFRRLRVCKGDDNQNGVDDLCDSVPTISQWGMVVLVLLFLTGIAIKFGVGWRPKSA